MTSIFTPIGATANLAVTSTTGALALDNVTAGGGRTVRLYNSGDVIVFVEFGTASTVEAATATSLPLGPGAVEWFELGLGITHIAAITSSGTATLYASEGRGS